jgi:integrase
MKLTTSNIRSRKLRAGERDLIIFDEEIPGFGLRLREGGFRGLIFQYHNGSETRRIAMGRVDAVNLANVRETAKDYYARVRLGQDPAAELRDAKVKRAETFEASAKLFLARQRARLRPRSYVDVERHIAVLAKPLHGMELAKIERRHIAARLTATEQDIGAITANRLRASLSSFFTWAIGAGLADVNPVSGTNRNEEKSRDRVLSPEDLRAIWRAVPDNQYGAIVKLLMLTGQRAGEIAGLRWSEVVGAEIVLPADRTKNHRPHKIALSEPAAAIIAVRPRRTAANGNPRELIFGSGHGPFSGWSTSKQLLDARIVEMNGAPLAPWRVHDLRRSFATHAAEIGILPHVIEAVLNHISGHKAGIQGVYNRALYEPEKRTAMVRWADQLLAWVDDHESNVVSFAAANV